MSTTEERERFYDEEIAPALLEIGRKCEAAGLSMVALVEWAPGEAGQTTTIREGAGVGILLTDMAARAQGNVDSLILAAHRYGKKHGHSSLYLTLIDRETAGAR